MNSMTQLPRSRPLTIADLETVPDDGHRYELVDGVLVVTPAPSSRHQWVVTRLLTRLAASCPDELMVFTAPFDVILDDATVLQPDLLVARRDALSERGLPGPPLLAVEILSPSTRLIDLNLKRARYEAAGCPSYWTVDPDVPSITGWQREAGVYVEVAAAAVEEPFAVTAPFAISFSPAELLT
jgi:Uma2 family endonuclease